MIEEVEVALEAVAETEVAVVASAVDAAVAVVASAVDAVETEVAVVVAAVVVVAVEVESALARKLSSSLTHASPAFTSNAVKTMCS